VQVGYPPRALVKTDHCHDLPATARDHARPPDEVRHAAKVKPKTSWRMNEVRSAGVRASMTTESAKRTSSSMSERSAGSAPPRTSGGSAVAVVLRVSARARRLRHSRRVTTTSHPRTSSIASSGAPPSGRKLLVPRPRHQPAGATSPLQPPGGSDGVPPTRPGPVHPGLTTARWPPPAARSSSGREHICRRAQLVG